MVLVKFKTDLSGGEEYLDNTCEYVYNQEKAISLSGNGVNPNNPNNVFDQMMAVKEYYDKTSNQPLMHIIVSYDTSVTDADTACQYTEEIAAYYQEQYQTLQCTHHTEHKKGEQVRSYYHTHIMLNPVSFKDGKMLNTSHENLDKFCDHVAEVTGLVTDKKFEKKKK